MPRTVVKGPLAFTAANNTELETYDASFVEVTLVGIGFIEIQSNKLTNTFGANALFIYRDGTPAYSADQYAKAALGFLSTLNNVRYGVAVRISADTGAGQDWYAVAVDDITSPRATRVYKCVNGTISTLDSRTSVTWANGDTIELEAVANGGNCDLLVYKNGALQYTITDSASPLTTGKPGTYCYDNTGGGSATLDDWEAGNVTAAIPILTLPTGSATGNTTGTAGATTDSASGTMYALARVGGAAASAATIVSTGTPLTITTTGAKTIPLTVLTTGSAYTVDICHANASGNSNVVTTAATFTPQVLASSGSLSAQTGVAGFAFTWAGVTPESQITTTGIGARTWTASGLGTSGLTINASTGVLSGTCGTAGSYTVTATNTDSSTGGTNPTGGGAPPQTIVRTITLTISASGDTTRPTLTGVVTITAVLSTTATATWPAGADNAAVTAYEYQLNGGAFVVLGNVLTTNLTGLTPSTAYTIGVRAKDAAGNVSTPVITGSFTTDSAAPGVFTSATLARNNDVLAASVSFTWVTFLNPTTGAFVVTKTGVTTNSLGVFTATDALLLSATNYHAVWLESTGKRGYGVAAVT